MAPCKRKKKNGKEVRYQGVRRRQPGKYDAEIRDPINGYVWLGTFNSAVEAAKAFDVATIKFRGLDKAKTNFPIPKNNINNVDIQTHTTIDSSTSTHLPLHVPLPNHVMCSTSHHQSHSNSSSAPTVKVGKKVSA